MDFVNFFFNFFYFLARLYQGSRRELVFIHIFLFFFWKSISTSLIFYNPIDIFFFRYGHFSGINRKVQLTYLPHGCPKTSSEEEGISFLMPIAIICM